MSTYDHYFTSVDANVYLEYTPTNLRVHLDKCIGIGYNHSMSSLPVYTLGNVEPTFFTRGNSLVQGNLDLAFKSTKYLQTGLKHLLKISSYKAERDTLLEKATAGTATADEMIKLSDLQRITVNDIESISLASIRSLFNIIIEFNNENSSMDGTSSTLTLKDVIFTSFGGAVQSAQENILIDRYSFMAKNVR